jgi:AraC-like DNA-binding protein
VSRRRRQPKPQAHDSLAYWEHDQVTVERYECAPSRPRTVAPHSHEAIQIAWSSTALAAYRVGGTTQRMRPDVLSIIGSGQVHETYEVEAIPEHVTYWITYVSPLLIARVAAEVFRRPPHVAHLHDSLLEDTRVAELLAQFHRSLSSGTTLARDDTLLAALHALLARCGDPRASFRVFGAAPGAIRTAREFLRDNVRRNVALTELADVAGVSPSHLSALFARHVGMSPHRFQLQVRIEAAKALLAEGHDLSEVAWRTGFSHQSHFGRHFKRLVGVAPGRFMPNARRR